MVAENTRGYELVTILSPEATEDEVSSSIERIDGLIKDNGGSVTEHDTWGLRRLAFPINKFQEGNYVLTKFALDPDSLTEFHRTLTASEDVLRFMVSKV